jgi:nicastrin
MMTTTILSLLSLLITIFLINTGNIIKPISSADPIQVIQTFPQAAQCSRLYTVTGDIIGCSTQKDGIVGITRWKNSTSDLTTTNLLITLTEPTAIVISLETFTQPEMVNRMDDLIALPHLVKGLVIVQQQTAIALETTTIHNPSQPTPYNPLATGLIHKNIPFPIILLNPQDSESFISNKQSSQMLSVSFYMGPNNMNSTKCLQLGMCLPLGGQSVWGVLGSRKAIASSSTSNQKLILLTAKMDSLSFFHDYSLAAFTSNMDVIVLLATLHTIGKLGNTMLDQLPYRIAGGIFQGESWNRIGSRRFVRDVGSGQGCKQFSNARNVSCLDPPTYQLEWTQYSLINFERIISLDLVIQSKLALNSNLTVHSVGNENNKNMKFAQRFSTNFNNVDPKKIATSIQQQQSSSLPESPWTSFQENSIWNSNPNTVGVVLAGYNHSYLESTPRYHSELDTITAANVSLSVLTTRITNVVNALARAVIAEAFDIGNKPTSDVLNMLIPDQSFILNLLNCLAVDFTTCILAQDSFPATEDDLKQRMSNDAFSASAGVRNHGPLNTFSGIFRLNAVRTGNLKTMELFIRDAFFNATRSSLTTTTTAANDVGSKSCSSDVECRDTWLIPTTTSSSSSSSSYCNSINFNSSTACIGGQCMCTNVYYHDAWSSSLDFDQEQSIFIINKTSAMENNDPIWTEPNWSNVYVKTFAPTNENANIAVLICGIMLTLLSIGGIFSILKIGKNNPKLKLL